MGLRLYWLGLVALGLLNVEKSLKLLPFDFIQNFSYLGILNFLLGTIIIIVCAYGIILSGWEQSQPNEWLIITQNGEMVKAGVGLRTFRWFFQNVLRFSSSIQKATFSASQVTEEMQGLEIQGFVIYGVHRMDDGPFKFYKFMNTYDSSKNVQRVCESIIRHKISNSKLEEVITKREIIREDVKKELQIQIKGWGIWLETVEITEVKICSRTLFEDLQAEFKTTENQKAEIIRIQTKNQLSLQERKNQFEIFKFQSDSLTKQFIQTKNQELERRKQEQKYLKQNVENRIQDSKRQLVLQKKQIEDSFTIKKTNLEQDLKMKEKKVDEELSNKKKQLELENQMSDLNFQKYQIDSSYRILRKLPLNNITVNSYIPTEENGVNSLVPGVNQLFNGTLETLGKK